jgi:phage/plasmid-like protein (TIGR03299 family)
MAHEITNTNGISEMAFSGNLPWHNLGQKLEQDVGSFEMIKAAHLDWSVSKMDMVVPNCDPFLDIAVPEKVAIVRNDTKAILSVVGEDYAPIQNTEMFAFFESLVGCGELKYETAGSLFGGRRVFATAKTKNQVRINGTDDVSDTYICVFNSHDGSLALKSFFTNIRVVCNNTLNAAIRGAKNAVSIRHTGDISSRIQEAQTILNINAEYTHKFSEIANHLALKQVDSKMVEQFLLDCFAPKKEEGDEASTRAKNIMTRVKNNFENDPKNNLKGISGTAWSLLNAVTQFADHEAVAVKKNADMRMNSIMFGTGATMKQKAFDLVTMM